MKKRILITGGAGFLGSHLADALLAYGYQVRVLDVLSPQVHGMKVYPRVTLAEGLEEMVEWLAGQLANDYSAKASAELRKRGLVVSTTSV